MTAIAVADQDHAAQVSVVKEADDVRDMRLQIDFRAQQVCALSETGQRRAQHRMTRGSKTFGNVTPAPAAEPRTGNE
jgi:hypothetical protein